MIEIDMPGMDVQRHAVLEMETKEAIEKLNKNLTALHFPKCEAVDYSKIDVRVFNTLEQGWIAPPAELVDAWFSQVKSTFKEFRSDEKLGFLLGLRGQSADRRIRAYRKGDEAIPYGIWRNFLVITGRAVQEIPTALGIFDMEEVQAVKSESGTARD
ncbi:hypothetical protein [Pantoea agglomerans]|uniref:hypothetical protein n=1 Tax=Enterobacter agglomerans TaxID=549 RepID=UPI001F111549|nr:hypothetical protein [Pantoea agglomerans]